MSSIKKPISKTNSLAKIEENKLPAINQTIDLKVSQIDLVDMAINEELGKISILKNTLNDKCNATNQASIKLTEELKPKKKKVIADVITKEVDKILKNYFKPNHGLKLVFSEHLVNIILETRKYKKERISERMFRDEWSGGDNLALVALITNKEFVAIKKDKNIKICDLNFIDPYKMMDCKKEFIFPLEFQKLKFDFSSVEKLEEERGKLDEENKNLNEQINQLIVVERSTKNKRDEIKASLTRGALSQSDEGKIILAELDLAKANMSIVFDEKTFLSKFDKTKK